MPLPKQIVDLPLAVGIDQTSDEKIAKGLLDLVNGEILKSGAITKRAGFSALGTAVKNGGIVEPDMPAGLRPDAASSLTKGFRLYSRGEQLVVSGFDSPDGGADANGHTGCIQTAYQPDVDQHTPCGLGTPCSFTVQHTGPGTLNEASPNMATGRGYRVYLADDGTNTSIKVLRAETGEVVHQLTTAGICGKGAFVGAAGSEKYIGYVLTSTGLALITWDASDPLTAPVITGAALPSAGLDDVFDVCPTADGVNLLVAHTATNGGSPTVYVREFDNAGTVQRTAFAVAGADTPEAITVFTVGTKVVMVAGLYDSGTTTRTVTAHVLSSGVAFTEDVNFDVAMTVTTTKVIQLGGVQFPGSSSFLLMETTYSAAAPPFNPYDMYTLYYAVCSLTAVESSVGTVFYNAIYAKPFVYEGRAYAVTVPTEYLSPLAYALLSFQRDSLTSTDLAYPRLNARMLAFRADGPRVASGLSHVTDEGSGIFSFAALREEVIVDAVATTKSTVGISIAVHSAAPSAISFGGNTIVPGGVISQLDGYYDDIGFPVYPLVTYWTGSFSSPGTYQYCVILEWTDRSGRIHRTAPTLAKSATDRLQVTVYPPREVQPHRFTSPGIMAAIYRTENGGTIFYRVGMKELTSYTASVTFDDNVSDATLITHEPLYTSSGELEVDSPPPSGIMGASHNRLFAVPYDDPTSLWFTKPLADPYAPEFSAAQYLTIPTGGDITGFAFLDGQHLVFKRSSIWRFVGDGPDIFGVGTFSQPAELSTRVGCVDPHSLAVFDDGVMFRSAAGWQLLDRSMNVQPVGLPVSDYADRSVAHSFTVPKRQQLWFLLEHQAGDTDTTVLVYDYLKRIWWRHAIPGTVVDMLYNGDDLVYYLTSAGVIYQQGVTASTTDALTIDTPWYKGQSIQGYMRLWWVHLLGDLDDSFTVKVYYDYKDAPTDYVQTVSVPAEAGRKMVRVKPALHKFTSFRLQITVPALSDITLNALALVATSKGRGAPLLKARTL